MQRLSAVSWGTRTPEGWVLVKNLGEGTPPSVLAESLGLRWHSYMDKVSRQRAPGTVQLPTEPQWSPMCWSPCKSCNAFPQLDQTFPTKGKWLTQTHTSPNQNPCSSRLWFSLPHWGRDKEELCAHRNMAADFLHCMNITALEAYLETLCAFVDNPIMKFKRPNAIVSRKIYLLKGKQLSHK